MALESPSQARLPLLAVRELNFHRDIETILRFQVEIYETNFPGFRVTATFLRDYRRQLRRVSRQWSEGLFVLDDGQQPRGFLWVGLITTLISPTIGYIKNIYIAPELRGQGWGRELLRTAEQWAAERGATEIELDASVCNEEAVRMYESAGYGTRRLRMAKDLRSFGA
ncbi:MAG: GNAT family N-acetyltransferase [Armatimonadetes bacterium]|nr:GNAT family N-acetyltransferase [Armatimonadota bacterium]